MHGSMLVSLAIAASAACGGTGNSDYVPPSPGTMARSIPPRPRPYAIVSGVVIRPSGAPVAGVIVNARPAWSTDSPAAGCAGGSRFSTSGTLTDTTDMAGHFHFAIHTGVAVIVGCITLDAVPPNASGLAMSETTNVVFRSATKPRDSVSLRIVVPQR